MNSNLSTLKIEEEISKFMESAYPSLCKEYIMFTIAMAIACVIVPIFMIRVLGKYERRVAETKGKPYSIYLFRSTAKLGLHYTLIIFLPILSIRRLYYSIQLEKMYEYYGKELSLFCLFLLLFTFIAVYHLFKFYSRGLIETGIVAAIGVVYKHCVWLKVARIVMSMSADYRAVAKYGFYIMADSMVARSMAADTVMLGGIIFFTFYYYKRRFLFMPEKLHMPKCVYCGKPIMKGEHFCTCCGTAASVESEERLISPLDEVKHCRICGRAANDYGCIACDTQDYLKKIIEEKNKEKKISTIRGVILTIIFMVLLLIPQIEEVAGKLQRGSAQVNNAFVVRWNELDEQPDKAADSAWLAGFDADLNALYTIDSRWYYVQPRMVLSDKLWYYEWYAEASFVQMKVLEEISEFVHNTTYSQQTEDIFYERQAELQARFNETIMEQQKALLPRYDAASPWGILGKFEYMCYDGLIYYLRGVSVLYVSVFIMIACMAMLVYMLNGFSITTETGLERWCRKNSVKAERYTGKHNVVYPTFVSASVFYRIFTAMKCCGHSFVRVANEIWMLIVRLICMIGMCLSLFRIRNIKKCVRWVINGLTDDKPPRVVGEGDHMAYKRAERKQWIIAIAISAVLFTVTFAMAFLSNYQKPSQKEQYLQLADEAVNSYSTDISAALTRIEDSRTLSEREREQLYALFDKQIEADRRILDYDMTELGDCLDFHAGLCGLCEDDIKMIESLKETLDNNLVPSRELQKNYVSLRGKNYIWVLEELAQKSLESTIDAFFNL